LIVARLRDGRELVRKKLFISFTESESLTVNPGGVLKKQSSGVMCAGLFK